MKEKKLPSNQQVLQLLFYKTRQLNMPLKNSMTDVLKEVQCIWDKAQIPVQCYSTMLKKLDSLYNDYRNLQRSKSRNTSRLEDDFKNKLKMLFDIAHKNVMDTLTEERKTFLLSQRSVHKFGFVELLEPQKNLTMSGNICNISF